MSEARVLIMRPRPFVFDTIERMLQEIGFPERGVSIGQATIVDRDHPERLSFRQTVDGKATISGTMGFRELPGGTSVTCSVEVAMTGTGRLTGLASRALNRTVGKQGAEQILTHYKRQIDDLPREPGS